MLTALMRLLIILEVPIRPTVPTQNQNKTYFLLRRTLTEYATRHATRHAPNLFRAMVQLGLKDTEYGVRATGFGAMGVPTLHYTQVIRIIVYTYVLWSNALSYGGYAVYPPPLQYAVRHTPYSFLIH